MNIKRKYKIIYADPPWSYQDGGVPRDGVNKQYQTMNLQDIKNLSVSDIADDISVLLLWSTFPQLENALEVIRAWGFKYKTLGFNWVKTNKDGSIFLGIGHYSRSNAEVCLLGVRGNAISLVKSHSVSNVVMHPKAKHSEKPPIVRDKIVQLFGDLPRIELFARQKIKGWDAWGDEVESDIQLT